MKPLVAFALLALLPALAGACVRSQGQDAPSLPAAPHAAANRLDIALAHYPEGWDFSASLESPDGRLPLRILLRAEPPVPGGAATQGAASQAPDSVNMLEAALLTETSMVLCSLRLNARESSLVTALPSSQVENLCRWTGEALRHLILTPQPDGPVRGPVEGRFLAYDGMESVRFLFAADGPLLEKEGSGQGLFGQAWTADYAGHTLETAVYVPATCRYTQGNRELRLLRITPKD